MRRSWRLNERHYGDLTGKDKKETVDKFGAEQVHDLAAELRRARRRRSSGERVRRQRRPALRRPAARGATRWPSA